jgi:CRP-like cAMP-binding protein
VKISRISPDGKEIILTILGPGEIFIKEMAEEHGRTIAGDENQREVKLGLTHEDIAKLTAIKRQTVTTQLNKLKNSGLIKYDRKRIYILDLDRL